MMTYPDQQTVSTRDLAWNVAGTSVSESAGRGLLADTKMTAEEVLDLSGLSGWNVRHAPLTVGMGDDPSTIGDWGVKMPNHRAVLATIGGEVTPLGVVGTKHHLVQNEETAGLLNGVADASGANFVAGGLLKGGRQTFVVMQLPGGIMIGGEDAHDLYFGCNNYHEGGSLTAWVTGMRLRCTNALNSSMRGAKSRWRLRHTASIGGKVQEVRESLGLTFKWVEEFEATAEQMLLTPMSSTEFDTLVERLAPPSSSDKAGWIARAEEKRQTLRFLFNEAPTNEFGRGTRWAAYNAFTEYADWMLPIKSKAPKARAERILADAAVDNFKQAAFDALVPA